MEETKQLVDIITEGIQEKKGSGIVIADLREIEGSIANYFVICQGSSPAQVEAIAESVSDFARKKAGENLSMWSAWAMTNGWPSTMWMCWYTYSNQRQGPSMIWRIFGKMLH